MVLLLQDLTRLADDMQRTSPVVIDGCCACTHVGILALVLHRHWHLGLIAHVYTQLCMLPGQYAAQRLPGIVPRYVDCRNSITLTSTTRALPPQAISSCLLPRLHGDMGVCLGVLLHDGHTENDSYPLFM